MRPYSWPRCPLERTFVSTRKGLSPTPPTRDTRRVPSAASVKRAARWRHFVALVNGLFFLFAAFAAIWLLLLAAIDDRAGRWTLIFFVVLLWATLAYIFLPRVYRLITAALVPDYFIGRARTSSGLLGDVVNMAWDGPDENIHRVMQAAGWTLAAPITFRSSLGIIGSVLFRKKDPDAPVSPLFLFRRKQDFAYEMDVGGSANRRHHIRFWRCPPQWPLPGGVVVDWLAAAAFDKGVRLSGFTLQVTHAISGDVDKERDFTLESIEKVDPDVKVSWIKKFSTAFHARNGGGDMVHTDGNLPIVDLKTLPESIPELSPAQLKKISVTDPLPATTIRELRKQTPFPLGLALAALVTALLALREAFVIADGSTPYPVATWGFFIGFLITLIATLDGRSSGRFLLMGVYSTLLVHLFTEWLKHDEIMQTPTAVFQVLVATVMLLVLTSVSVTEYTDAFTKWRVNHRSRSAQRATHP